MIAMAKNSGSALHNLSLCARVEELATFGQAHLDAAIQAHVGELRERHKELQGAQGDLRTAQV